MDSHIYIYTPGSSPPPTNPSSAGVSNRKSEPTLRPKTNQHQVTQSSDVAT